MKKFRFCLLLSFALILFFSPVRAMKVEEHRKFTVDLAVFVQAVYNFFDKSPRFAEISTEATANEMAKLNGIQEILPRLTADVSRGSIDAYKNLSLLTSLSRIVVFALKIFEDATIPVSDDLKKVSDFLSSDSAKGLLDTKKLRRRLPRGALQKSEPLAYRFVGIDELGKMASELVYSLDITDVAYLQINVTEQFSMLLLIEQFLMPFIVAYEFPKYREVSHPSSIVVLMAKLRLIQCLKSVPIPSDRLVSNPTQSTRSNPGAHMCDDDIIFPPTAAALKPKQGLESLEIQQVPHFCSDCVECRLRAKSRKKARRAAAFENLRKDDAHGEDGSTK